ncbi:MAG: rhamnogalacturonan acetylesterase [Pseudomonadales bacterium]
MRTLIFGSFILAVLLLLCGFSELEDSTVHADDTRTPTLFIAGDSTATKHINRPRQGWGEVLGEYLNQQQVSIDNRAVAGRSSRTFISQGHWQKLLDDVTAGDTVLIQFGHNDVFPINDETRAKGVLPGIGENSVDIVNMLTKTAETVYSYGHYIRKMIEDTRAKKATPILISLTVRNLWQDGRIERGLGQYNAWLYQVAIEQNTQFIDITNSMADQLEAMGINKTARLYPEDHTHFSRAGAHLYAQAIVTGLKGL